MLETLEQQQQQQEKGGGQGEGRRREGEGGGAFTDWVPDAPIDAPELCSSPPAGVSDLARFLNSLLLFSRGNTDGMRVPRAPCMRDSGAGHSIRTIRGHQTACP